MAFKRKRKNPVPKPDETQAENESRESYFVDASAWSESRVLTFLKQGIRWLTDDERDHCFFLQYCHENNVFQKDLTAWAQGKGERVALMISACWESEQGKIARMASKQRINPAFGMFFLKARHSWKEYKTVEHQGVVVMQHDLKDLTE